MERTIDNNGNVLIPGTKLSSEQFAKLKFIGMGNPDWVKCHSFWFKDDEPSTEEGYYYPVVKSFEFLPY